MILMLSNRWQGLCDQAGLSGADGWTLLLESYGDAGRAYHNLNHIADCLFRMDEHVDLAANPLVVELAIWFHDIVYDPHAADNEVRSAEVAADFLAGTSMAPAVAELILATRHGNETLSEDAALMCDIDLSILGQEPEVYDSYARAVRQEYLWVPRPQYAEARIRVLGSFLERPSIYALEVLESRYGEQARANLAREIRSLSGLVPV